MLFIEHLHKKNIFSLLVFHAVILILKMGTLEGIFNAKTVSFVEYGIIRLRSIFN